MAIFTQNLKLPSSEIQIPNPSLNLLGFRPSNAELREKKRKPSQQGDKQMAIACYARSALPRVLRPLNLNFSHLSSDVTAPLSHFPTIYSDGIINRSSTCRFITNAAGNNSESNAVPNSVPVRVAYELLQAGHRYLDVRTSEEFSAGHPSGAVNVPYLLRAGADPEMTKNPKFVAEVSSNFGKDTEIVVGCQKGRRSLMAAAELVNAGFTGITDVGGGYSAWVQSGLPTSEE